MNVEIRQYEKGDEFFIDDTVEDRPIENPAYWKIWRVSVNPEHTWTMLTNDKVVAIGGFWPYGQNGAAVIVWLSVAQKLPAKLSFVRTVKHQIDQFLGRYERVEAIIRDNFVLGPRWMKFLGFKPQKRWIVNGIDCGAQIYVKESDSGCFTDNTFISAGCDGNRVCDLIIS